MRTSALGVDNIHGHEVDMVHVLFKIRQDVMLCGKELTYIGFYMPTQVYHAVKKVNATPDDYRQHGELQPAPAIFSNGSTTKEMVPA